MVSDGSSVENARPRPVPALTSLLPPLIGREREVAVGVALLRRDNVRLLTLTGPGGIGKTRLGMEVAETLDAAFSDGVCFVPLAEVGPPEPVVAAIAQCLNLAETSGVDLFHTLASALRDMHLLLVLDNFEHVLDTGSVVKGLLQACPHLKVLVTSQALLRVTGEHALPVPPLQLPGVSADQSVEDVARSSAVRLFMERAQSVDPSFVLTESNASVVAAICHRLDGLPLAIELAATQIRVLPPVALLTRLRARQPLPFPGPRDAPDRQSTLRKLIGWSYALLRNDEQRLFRCVGVFTGGFGLEAARAVSDLIARRRLEATGQAESAGITGSLSPGPPTADILGGLASLVDRSLLQQRAWGGDSRFTMLETIRDFALDQLVTLDEHDTVRDAHADWCLDLAERTRLASIIPGGEQQLLLLELEQGNFRSALDWLHEHGDSDRLVRLVLALSGFWYAHSHYREGRAWLERALAASTGDARARLLVHLGLLLLVQGDTARARRLLDEGLEVLRGAGDVEAIVLALIWQGATANSLGEYERAERFLDEALGLASSISDPSVAASTSARALANLGVSAHLRGNLDVAMVRHELALGTCRQQGYLLGMIRSLCDLGNVARDQANYARSLSYYRECLTLLGDSRELRVIVNVFEGTALAAAAWNQPEEAARLLGAAEALTEQSGARAMIATEMAARQRALEAVRASLGETRFRDAWSIGRQLTVPLAIDEIDAIVPSAAAADQAPAQSAIKLSPREEDVLGLLVTGISDREMADALFLGVRTVEAHVSRIRAKLGVRTRTAAVTAALAAGLIDPVLPRSDSSVLTWSRPPRKPAHAND